MFKSVKGRFHKGTVGSLKRRGHRGTCGSPKIEEKNDYLEKKHNNK